MVLLPGAAVSGDVQIGEGTLVGSNAFIFQGCKIGKMNQVDALTYIRKDLPDYMLSSSRKTKTIKRKF